MKPDALLTVRPATVDDVPLVLSLIRGLAEYEKLAGELVATEELLLEHLFGLRPSAEVLVGFCDGQPAGYALFFPTFSTFLGRPGIYLEDVFVLPEFRGMGLGKKLLIEVARIARSRNCGRLEWSVLDWNEPSIGFYKRLGAEPLGEWTMYRVTGDTLDRLAEGG